MPGLRSVVTVVRASRALHGAWVYPPPARATAGSRSTALQFQQTSSATAHSNKLRKVEFWTFASSTLMALASSLTLQHQQPKLLVCKKHFDPLTLIMDCDGGEAEAQPVRLVKPHGPYFCLPRCPRSPRSRGHRALSESWDPNRNIWPTRHLGPRVQDSSKNILLS